MDDFTPIIASAVLVPEAADDPQSPTTSTKRRQSGVSDESNKRPRLRAENDGVLDQPSTSAASSMGERRPGRSIDERKRGKRLFGALLGTLAQNSSSTAQKRRVDIEKKQQEKLKLQAEEYNEKEKQEIDELTRRRRMDQDRYDEQSLHIRHSNLLAMANFLHTKAQPKLYYKPWELLPEEEDRIKAQISEAEANAKKDLTDFKKRRADTIEAPTLTSPVADTLTEETGTVGEPANRTETNDAQSESNANHKAHSSITNKPPGGSDGLKDALEDGAEDVVVGDEDTVIY